MEHTWSMCGTLHDSKGSTTKLQELNCRFAFWETQTDQCPAKLTRVVRSQPLTVHNLGYAFDLMSRLIPIDKERDDIKNQSCKAVNFFMDGCSKRTS